MRTYGNSGVRFPPFFLLDESRNGPSAVVGGLPEPVLVGPLVAWNTVWAGFHPPGSQSTLSGWFVRSEANFRLSECQPRPRFGSSPERSTTLFHQSRTSDTVGTHCGTPRRMQ